MYILGISCYYHDSSAALIKDGVIVAAAEEERFSRKKHDNSFPKKAVTFCLEKGGITINSIDHIAFYEKPIVKFERVLMQFLHYFPKSYFSFVKSMPSWLSQKLMLVNNIRKLGYSGDVIFIKHHLAHAASAFLVSGFEKAAIVTVDGVGEWNTTAFGFGNKNQVTMHKKIDFPHSLGLLYSTITAYLGFKVNNSEYKVMGLSSYGNKNKQENQYYKKLKKVIKVLDDGSFSLDLSYFSYPHSLRMPSKRLCKLLGGNIRKPHDPIAQREKDIACALQMIYEETLFKIINYVHSKFKSGNLVLAGGCALNSVANGKILKKTQFKKVWIQPAASDSGGSLGAALYTHNCILKNNKRSIQNHVYYGPNYTQEYLRNFLDSNNIKYSVFKSSKEVIKNTAKLIYENNVVGWFMGKMELGPRALGNRSILANPCNPNAKEALNLKVKHRENFRPFAPVVCAEDATEYFECDVPLPKPTDYMLMVYPIRPKWRDKIPSVSHIDGSGRLQTIRRNQNQMYYDLIKEFGKLSKIPILINTSFNIRGEPIVCTPHDAYRCMMGTEIDYLVMGKFLISRKDNIRDIWESEGYD